MPEEDHISSNIQDNAYKNIDNKTEKSSIQLFKSPKNDSKSKFHRFIVLKQNWDFTVLKSKIKEIKVNFYFY